MNGLKAKLFQLFKRFDAKVDGAVSFFVRHYGKTKFMVAMSKKAQTLGLEKLFMQGPKAFVYFFLFYLIRDTILYIIIPISIATCADKKDEPKSQDSVVVEKQIKDTSWKKL